MFARHFSAPLRHSLRQFNRPIHTTPVRHASTIDWRGPLRTLGIRNPFSVGAGALSLAFFLTFPFWFKQPLPADYNQRQNDELPAPVRGTQGAQVQWGKPPSNSVDVRSVADDTAAAAAKKTDNFPEVLEVDGFSERFRLVAWGVRTVSFLRIQVYNVGLYIPESQYAVIPTFSLSNVESDPWPAMIRMYPCPLLLRIIPVRNTDYAHLRDGFVRSTQTRLTKYPDEDPRKGIVETSITSFKALFPKSKMKKGEVLSVLQKGPELHLYAGEDMKEHLGSVKNDDLARGLMSAYLVGDGVVSPDLQKKLRNKLLDIAAEKQADVEEKLKQGE